MSKMRPRRDTLGRVAVRDRHAFMGPTLADCCVPKTVNRQGAGGRGCSAAGQDMRDQAFFGFVVNGRLDARSMETANAPRAKTMEYV